MEKIEKSKDVWKGTKFWTDQIKDAGVYNKIKHFNDVITGKEAPHPQGYGDPVLTDIVLDGKRCDIYHTDKKPGDSGHRIYIHIKE
ncbi:MAG: hypothetical protein KGI50_04825 [Patescibacteria group bacterium]|nr:hypothetical protein [Patescibacteria group bacterium]MDE2438639.1 hypothetical protein [Patescibacteria group bacterium]